MRGQARSSDCRLLCCLSTRWLKQRGSAVVSFGGDRQCHQTLSLQRAAASVDSDCGEDPAAPRRWQADLHERFQGKSALQQKDTEKTLKTAD